MKLLRVLKICFLLHLTFLSESLNTFQITDIEIQLKLDDSQKTLKTYVINASDESKLVKNGSNFAIIKEKEDGNSVAGMLEAYAVGKRSTYAKLKQISGDIDENDINLGDLVFPVISVNQNELFSDKNSKSITDDGKKLLQELMGSLLEEEKLKLLQIFLNTDESNPNSGVQLKEIQNYLASINPSMEKKIEVLENVNLENLDNSNIKNRFDFIYISDDNDNRIEGLKETKKVTPRKVVKEKKDYSGIRNNTKLDDIRKKYRSKNYENKRLLTNLKEFRREKKVYKKGAQIVLPVINFDTGKWTIPENDYEKLDTLRYIFLDNPGIELEIRGFADPRGEKDYNQYLSEMRAKSVCNYILTNFEGTDSTKLKPIGMGETIIIEPEEVNNDSLLRKYRRIEFKVVKESRE
ncbi:MAG: OmpA family protein [Candidatus Delongbacteria bacterium]|nr:OmpA family protein [Candidatus Delongbacteria bacterium]MBN2835356.1 OmpA family protein [Candidatus Delongbacteria bacterium]